MVFSERRLERVAAPVRRLFAFVGGPPAVCLAEAFLEGDFFSRGFATGAIFSRVFVAAAFWGLAVMEIVSRQKMNSRPDFNLPTRTCQKHADSNPTNVALTQRIHRQSPAFVQIWFEPFFSKKCCIAAVVGICAEKPPSAT